MSSATPIVLVHGLPGSSLVWYELAALLAAERRVLVPERAARGADPVEAILAAAERERAVPFVLAGHSEGGLVALRVALERPNAVRALVLAAPPDVGDLRLELDRISCPALVLCGARDRTAPVDGAFELARRLRAPVRTIAAAGHLLVSERAAACAAILVRFLDGIG